MTMLSPVDHGRVVRRYRGMRCDGYERDARGVICGTWYDCLIEWSDGSVSVAREWYPARGDDVLTKRLSSGE